MKQNLKWMLMVRVGAIVFVVLVINTIISGVMFKVEITSRIKAQGEAISKDIIEDAQQSLASFTDQSEIAKVFNYWLQKMVENHSYLKGAALLDLNGRAISHNDPNKVGTFTASEIIAHFSDKISEPFRSGGNFAIVIPVKDSSGKNMAQLLLEFNREEYDKPMRTLILTLTLMFLISLGIIYFMLEFFAVTKFSKPLTELALHTEAVSTGDLTRRVKKEGSGEIRMLSEAFSLMEDNLVEILGKIKAVSEKFTETCRQLFVLSGEINQGSRHQMTSLNGASEAVRKMEMDVEEISNQIEELNHLSRNTSASILEMAASISEVDSNMDNMVEMVDEIASSILEIAQSTREVASSVESLSREAEGSASSISEMNVSLSHVDSSANQSAKLSVQVAETAEKGIKSIDNTLEGMRAIRTAAEGTAQSIHRLGERSSKIGKILGVINKIAEETNLLALNAAIIAAEAGEHGRGFNVVANEIQTLAERTTLQTKEIDALIKDVQRETHNSVEKVRLVLDSVTSGESLTSDTATILHNIVSVAFEANTLVQQIAKSTDEQAKGIIRVAEGSERVSSEVKSMSKATKEQASGASKIMEAIERIRDFARSVQSATGQQNEGSKNISHSIEQVRDSITLIHQRADRHRHDAELVSEIVARNLQIVEENVRRVQEMEASVETLLTFTAGLSDEIRRFKI